MRVRHDGSAARSPSANDTAVRIVKAPAPAEQPSAVGPFGTPGRALDMRSHFETSFIDLRGKKRTSRHRRSVRDMPAEMGVGLPTWEFRCAMKMVSTWHPIRRRALPKLAWTDSASLSSGIGAASAPLQSGQLRSGLGRLAARDQEHRVRREPMRIPVAIIECWYYKARSGDPDPASVPRA